ncbi:MAG: LysR family transcriptional regulator [Pyrinomonadaceae bacterium]
MEFQQLEMFAAAVEEGSVRKASERVYRTAPAVSIALKKLEEEVGAPLFNRTDRGNQELTASGQLLYSYATQILTLRRDLVSKLQDLNHCRTGRVRIGANESTSLYLLPKLAHAFQEKYPDLKLDTLCDNSDRIISALKDGQIDLALVAFSGAESSLRKHLIMRDEIVLIANPDHRLAKLPHVTINHLEDEVLITENAKSSLQEEVAHAFEQAGVRLNITISNVTLEGIKRMAAEGVGVGFVPLLCVQDEEFRGELATIRVDGVSRQRELWLIHRDADSLTPSTKAFVKVSLKTARSWTNAQDAISESSTNGRNRLRTVIE